MLSSSPITLSSSWALWNLPFQGIQKMRTFAEEVTWPQEASDSTLLLSVLQARKLSSQQILRKVPAIACPVTSSEIY